MTRRCGDAEAEILENSIQAFGCSLNSEENGEYIEYIVLFSPISNLKMICNDMVAIIKSATPRLLLLGSSTLEDFLGSALYFALPHQNTQKWRRAAAFC